MSEVGQSSEAYEGNQGDQILKSMAWIILHLQLNISSIIIKSLNVWLFHCKAVHVIYRPGNLHIF